MIPTRFQPAHGKIETMAQPRVDGPYLMDVSASICRKSGESVQWGFEAVSIHAQGSCAVIDVQNSVEQQRDSQKWKLALILDDLNIFPLPKPLDQACIGVDPNSRAVGQYGVYRGSKLQTHCSDHCSGKNQV